MPENSISGVMMKRNRMLKPLSPSCLAENAKIGAAKASPVSTAIGRAAARPPRAKPPNSAATTMKIAVADGELHGDAGQVAEQDVAHAQRRREHRVVAPCST